MTKEELFAIKIDKPDMTVYDATKANFDALAKPIDGFGYIEDIICRIAAIHRNEKPDISGKALVVMFSDNGVVKSGVSQIGKSVTLDVARLFSQGKSTVGVMTEGYPIELIGVDVGIDSDEKVPGIMDRKVSKGTGNIEEESAMTEGECLQAIKTGIEIAGICRDKGIGLVVTGEMGIGNTTTATALLCALTGEDPDLVTGRGAGLPDEGLTKKKAVIKHALCLHGLDHYDAGKASPQYAFNALTCVGGLDIAALTGLFIGGGMYHIPVVIDGLISAVAALTACDMIPGTVDYMIASHKGREKGVKPALDRMHLHALIDADMALGEGTGGVMITPIIDMVNNVYNSGTSFESAQIRQYRRYEK